MTPPARTGLPSWPPPATGHSWSASPLTMPTAKSLTQRRRTTAQSFWRLPQSKWNPHAQRPSPLRSKMSPEAGSNAPPTPTATPSWPPTRTSTTTAPRACLPSTSTATRPRCGSQQAECRAARWSRFRPPTSTWPTSTVSRPPTQPLPSPRSCSKRCASSDYTAGRSTASRAPSSRSPSSRSRRASASQLPASSMPPPMLLCVRRSAHTAIYSPRARWASSSCSPTWGFTPGHSTAFGPPK